jgi:membrane protein
MIKGYLRTGYRRLRETVTCFLEDNGTGLAAEASFYLIFSLFPLLFLLVLILGSFGQSLMLGNPDKILAMLDSVLPQATYQTLVAQIQRMTEHYRPTRFFVTMLVFLWPASNVFGTYLNAANQAYGFPERRGYLKLRLITFFVLIVSGSFLFASAVLIGLVPVILSWIEGLLIPTGLRRLLLGGRYLAAILLISPSLALIYRFGPDTDHPEELKIWPGALFATVTWILFTQLFGLYLRYLDNIHLLYGTLGGAMLLLLWMYLSSIAVIAGAEFNYVLMQETDNTNESGGSE